MPTFAQMILPLSASWSEFEDIVLSSFKVRWKNPNLQKNGRQGQPQQGVDIWGLNHLSREVGIQCKNVASLTIKQIEEEVNKSEGFKPQLDEFYIATSLSRDAFLFEEVRLLSAERKRGLGDS
jgi:hypothetical protein